MRNINVLFLGAGKRAGLLNNFILGFSKYYEKNNIFLHSIELDNIVPIAKFANIIIGPKFTSDNFCDFLFDKVIQHNISVIIPCMDSALIPLANNKDALLHNYNCNAIVSSKDVCDLFTNKDKAALYYDSAGIKAPKTFSLSNANFPLFAKNKTGYGSRDQRLIVNKDELSVYLRENNDKYILQEYISGYDEYTIDSFVDKDKKILCCICRQRLEVVGGEVVKAKISNKNILIEKSKEILSKLDFYGPITLQFFYKDGFEPIIIEINPRFGGGVTASFFAGAKFIDWIYNDINGKSSSNIEYSLDKEFYMCRANKDYYLI